MKRAVQAAKKAKKAKKAEKAKKAKKARERTTSDTAHDSQQKSQIPPQLLRGFSRTAHAAPTIRSHRRASHALYLNGKISPVLRNSRRPCVSKPTAVALRVGGPVCSSSAFFLVFLVACKMHNLGVQSSEAPKENVHLRSRAAKCPALDIQLRTDRSPPKKTKDAGPEKRKNRPHQDRTKLLRPAQTPELLFTHFCFSPARARQSAANDGGAPHKEKKSARSAAPGGPRGLRGLDA
jgi:hypothetical protein